MGSLSCHTAHIIMLVKITFTTQLPDTAVAVVTLNTAH